MIIVGVDFSAGSAIAAAVARGMAEERRTESRLIHVRRSFGVEQPADERSDEWLEGLGLEASDVESRRGVPWVELVRAAVDLEAELVVAGTHGRSGFQPLRLGTTAELIALRSPTPVLLVPPIRVPRPAAARTDTKHSEEGE